ncbi:hypothetical protein TpMuguga_03g00070 [Theileria parva strain Muguga]|uniref:Immune mapped protein 2 N-terminal domain-containing protein n=1 Tax=Theileria parva TaxID=5875 RepID=Q4N0Z7_THEPA|nr:uncharacterized protein TpMuguga_03g00070 [Theileria parva strain Muguga]EAN30806.1 hypothetical protein TpMuguga_03g00070 [Theileria parva strain Muguga]|eukprot:XP_763089.1 hypothetical protein [Theileria parva strain Muguga]
MEVLNKICCNCCGKKKEDSEETEEEITESVLMIEDPFVGAKLVKKETEKKELPEPIEEEKRVLQTRKHLKTKKKQIERISIGGAVAALPPPPIEEIEGEIPKANDSYNNLKLGNGVYLGYSLENNGSLYLKYTTEKPDCMDGVLAYIRPDREILKYHYENNDGKQLISTNVREYMKSKFQHDRKKYFDAWQEFFQVLNSYGGNLYILSAFELSPPPRTKIVLFSNNNLTEIKSCEEVCIKENDLLGVFPFSLDYETKLNDKLTRKDFIDLCEKYGFVFQLIK